MLGVFESGYILLARPVAAVFTPVCFIIVHFYGINFCSKRKEAVHIYVFLDGEYIFTSRSKFRFLTQIVFPAYVLRYLRVICSFWNISLIDWFIRTDDFFDHFIINLFL